MISIFVLSSQSVASLLVTAVEKKLLRASAMQGAVERAVDVTNAQISVRMQRDNAIAEYIPWMDEGTPFIRVSVPQNWIDRTSKQIGSIDAAKQVLLDFVYTVAPNAKVEIAIIQNIPTAIATAQTSEPSPKQIVVLFGLFALLISGSLQDCRRRKEEIVIVRYEGTPAEEAQIILQMEHSLAKRAIDALAGTRKMEVLHAIVAREEVGNDLPIVEVAKKVQLGVTTRS